MTVIVQKLDKSFSMPDRLKIGGVGGREMGKRRDRGGETDIKTQVRWR